ncbi:GMP synthase [Rufibacter sp. DG15C]|uniref:glutamine-hydrolyzing GMP synthase n=1 Tax=Rufibacter sp. DG15C TaxID=1379909 RepID=UPI00078DCD6F|nr:glutamine-hydrolyzing GMP synthase [Rufibacter sp. DG15C]AMM52004.1 GMP synthase [Rufibacter sp. DG15C]
MPEKILILDFGSQYTQLIARRVRELNVYCEIHPYNKIPALSPDLKGVILSGSPCSVREKDYPNPDLTPFLGKLPVLGVCYGAQLMAQEGGGEVIASTIREYGRAKLNHVDQHNRLLKEITMDSQVWMSHGDTIKQIPDNFEIIASTESVQVAAYKVKDQETYGIQFHPEVTHSTEGKTLLRNFVVHICECSQDWTPDQFIETTVADLKEQIGTDKVILGLSGGVDSSVAAMLIHQAIGKNLYCIFVDNGLLRKDEFEGVLHSYKDMGLNVKGVDAKDMFYTALAGLSDPEEKRKAIGKVFIDVFDQESHLVEDAKWLGQGTIYPDVIESVSVKGPSATIKSHHNVGGLPDFMKLKVVEPLKTLFKDEVRLVGKTLGIDPAILGRHPFPGPGLAIRILGDVTPEKVAILQEVDHIFIKSLKNSGLYDQVWQAGAMLLPVQSVGVMGDERTYERVVALRAVTSIDGMTADWSHLPYEFLADVSNEIINKVRGVNRVVYDISSKPPATIEWE